MKNKNYYYKCPTCIYLINNGIGRAGEIINKEGFKKNFLIYGGSSLKKNGNLDKLYISLKTNNIDYISQGGVQPNPDISFVRDALKKVRKYKPDLIFAVGGGSGINTAKNLCKAYYYNGDPLDFHKEKTIAKKSLPLGVILTLSAAGSEMSNSCVISDRTINYKGGFSSDLNRPTFSILDPELTYSVSQYQTCCGLVDIISHSFERYFSPSNEYEISDYFALSVIRNTIEISPSLIKNHANYNARRAMTLTSTISHNGFTSFGKGYNMPCHAVEHAISGAHPNITPGLGLRFLLAEFMDVDKEKLKNKIFKLGKFCFDIDSNNPDLTIEAFKSYLDSLPLSKTMEEVGVTVSDQKESINRLILK